MARDRNGYGWEHPAVRAALTAAETSTRDVAALARQICEIPAPTFQEERRAAFVAEQFAAGGLTATGDVAGNVTAVRAGQERGGAVLLAAHTDTVFAIDTDVRVREDKGRMYAPGIGDNSLAVAALLTLPHILDRAGIRTQRDVILCANTGEEGLGDLRGIKQAVADHRDNLGAVIALEGLNLGRVTHQAVGSRRLRITVEGPGGHSWGAFGNPSAIHVLGQIISAIDAPRSAARPEDDLQRRDDRGRRLGQHDRAARQPRSSTSARSTPPPWRSSSGRSMRSCATRRAARSRTKSEIIGDRPAGRLAPDAPLMQIDDRRAARSSASNRPSMRPAPMPMCRWRSASRRSASA